MNIFKKTINFGNKGVHPAEMKLTAGKAIKDIPLPRRVEISLSQSLGKPAKAVVAVGDHVNRFALIGEAQGPVSSNVHTPISGIVKSIGKIETADGHGAEGIIIEASDTDHATDLQSICDATPQVNDINKLSREEIIKAIGNAGIVGMGGATFPTATKLAPPPSSPHCEYLLINGAECEPYLTCDEAIMREMSVEIITGIELMLRALGEEVKCIVGIEDNKPQAITQMTIAARNHSRISIVAMRTRYPQGGEKMLTKALVNREIASGQLPISQGVIIHNVSTALAVYHAVVWGLPLVERVMTISGTDFAASGNYRVPIGTSVKELIEQLGNVPETTIKIVNGGTMMGRAIGGLQGSTTKGMSGLLMLNTNETQIRETTPCVRCGKCVDVCPMGLEPYLIARLAELSRKEDLKAHHVLDCMECGCCSYSCMAGRRLVDWIKVGKAIARKN